MTWQWSQDLAMEPRPDNGAKMRAAEQKRNET